MKIPQTLESKKIVVIGDIMLDRYWWGDVTRISPEAPVPVVRLYDTSIAVGGAANVAANIAALGATPILFGLVGDDPEGLLIRELLPRVGVSGDHLLTEAVRPTTVKTRIVARSQHVARVDHEYADPLSAETETRILEQIAIELASAQALIVSDYAKGVLSERVLRAVLDTAKSKGVPSIVDPKGKEFQKYRDATLLTPNRREAAEACGLDPDSANVVELSGSRLLSVLADSSVLITEGENGMTLFVKDEAPFHTRATAREVFDVTGAGDTVVAALAVGVGNGGTFRDSVKFANAAAGIAVEKMGTAVVTMDMVRERISLLSGSGRAV